MVEFEIIICLMIIHDSGKCPVWVVFPFYDEKVKAIMESCVKTIGSQVEFVSLHLFHVML